MVAELGHDHVLKNVGMYLDFAIPDDGRGQVVQGVDGLECGAVRKEVRRLEGG